MKKVMIDGKEYWKQEECDIPKISMPMEKDILKKYKFDKLKLETCQDDKNGTFYQNNLSKPIEMTKNNHSNAT